MNTVDTRVACTATRVTQMNTRRARRLCPRCHEFGISPPSCIVCARCANPVPLTTSAIVTVALVLVGGGR
jgi:hypothetical protein